MVSLQSALWPAASRPSVEAPKKRKRDDDSGSSDEEAESAGIELSFDAAPLPPEWQRCLDIKSGQIHYYNTRTHARTREDPRGAHSPERAASPTLDLELNLTSRSGSGSGPGKKPKPEPEPELEQSREMVAAVCMRCHMLVMMWRASPACPNCKFVHPPSRSGAPAGPAQPAQPKLGFKLLCCND